jgi:hypothetical protein
MARENVTAFYAGSPYYDSCREAAHVRSFWRNSALSRIRRYFATSIGLNVRQMARYWSRDGRTEIDLIAELDNGSLLFGECKWRTESVRCRNQPSYIFFALGGISPELRNLPSTPPNGFSWSQTQICTTEVFMTILRAS